MDEKRLQAFNRFSKIDAISINTWKEHRMRVVRVLIIKIHAITMYRKVTNFNYSLLRGSCINFEFSLWITLIIQKILLIHEGRC